ncbi:type II secretion system protein GspM [Thalassotalea aquiviva]|uniref:type II secretion system protein GspM n=1 Tax=Thalassotalea aquiviva TaxID=3242415 RepID=UPI00352B9370
MLKEKWQALNQREKSLVAIMALVVTIFLFVTVIWQPLNDSVERSKERVERQQKLAAWMATNLQRYQALKQQGGVTSTGSLSSIVNRTARSQNITLARMQPQGDDLQVWIDEVPFDNLITWLDSLTTREGLHVEAIDIAPASVAGTVKVRRLQVSKG